MAAAVQWWESPQSSLAQNRQVGERLLALVRHVEAAGEGVLLSTNPLRYWLLHAYSSNMHSLWRRCPRRCWDKEEEA
jgi:hypothetical protein